MSAEGTIVKDGEKDVTKALGHSRVDSSSVEKGSGFYKDVEGATSKTSKLKSVAKGAGKFGLKGVGALFSGGGSALKGGTKALMHSSTAKWIALLILLTNQHVMKAIAGLFKNSSQALAKTNQSIAKNTTSAQAATIQQNGQTSNGVAKSTTSGQSTPTSGVGTAPAQSNAILGSNGIAVSGASSSVSVATQGTGSLGKDQYLSKAANNVNTINDMAKQAQSQNQNAPKVAAGPER